MNYFKQHRMKTKLMTALLLVVGVFAMAQKKNQKLTFEVDGKCDMCKVRIEKAALGVTGVKFAEWDIPSHELSLVVDGRKTNAMQVKTALVAAGHDTKELKATKEAYDNIHPCCKYREDNTDDSKGHAKKH